MKKTTLKSKRIRTTLITVLLALTMIIFSGCTYPSASGGNAGTKPNIGITIYPDGQKPEDSKQDIGKDGVDMSEVYKNLLGIKVSYDASAHTLETLNDVQFEATYSRVSTALQNTATFDPETFVSENAELGVNATYVSRVVWIYNYINQYRALATMILTDLAKNYGLGLGSDLVINNGLYGSVSYTEYTIPDDADYKTDKNAINIGVTAITDSVTVANPFYGLGEATYSNGGITVDFNTTQNLTLQPATALPSVGYSFLLNLNADDNSFAVEITNPYYDPDNIVNKPIIYDASTNTNVVNPNYIDDHILGKEKLVFVGTISADGTITYAIGTETRQALTANEFVMQYTEKYTDYLALKLLEAHTLTTDKFLGAPNEVAENNFFAHYSEWLTLHNKLGFESVFYSSNNEEYVVADVFAEVVTEFVVGESVLNLDENAGDYKRDIENTVKQLVLDSITAKMSKNADNFVIDNDNGETYFKTVYCIEYRDYSSAELFGVSATEEETASSVRAQNVSASNVGDCEITVDTGDDDTLILPEENYYSIVIMINEGASPCVMSGIITLFWAKNNDIYIDMAYRYVIAGSNKIYANVDYSVMPEQEDEEELICNEFTGLVEKYEGEELTMEMADKSSFSIEDYNTPNIDTIKNKEITLSKFTNNFVASYAKVQNVSLVAYEYDSDLNYYYFGERSENCDYVELGLRAYLDENASTTDTLPFSTSIVEIGIMLQDDETDE